MQISYKPKHAPPTPEVLARVAMVAKCSEPEILDLLRLGHETVRLPHPFGGYTLVICPHFWRAA